MGAKLKEIKEGLRKRMAGLLSGPTRAMAWPFSSRLVQPLLHKVATNICVSVRSRFVVMPTPRRRSLPRHSQKDVTTWERIESLAREWLPPPKILHPWPSDRFRVKHPRWEPYAGIPPVRI